MFRLRQSQCNLKLHFFSDFLEQCASIMQQQPQPIEDDWEMRGRWYVDHFPSCFFALCLLFQSMLPNQSLSKSRERAELRRGCQSHSCIAGRASALITGNVVLYFGSSAKNSFHGPICLLRRFAEKPFFILKSLNATHRLVVSQCVRNAKIVWYQRNLY